MGGASEALHAAFIPIYGGGARIFQPARESRTGDAFASASGVVDMGDE